MRAIYPAHYVHRHDPHLATDARIPCQWTGQRKCKIGDSGDKIVRDQFGALTIDANIARKTRRWIEMSTPARRDRAAISRLRREAFDGEVGSLRDDAALNVVEADTLQRIAKTAATERQ